MTHDEFSNFRFTLAMEHENGRQTYRVAVSDIVASVAGKDGTFPVHDVSASGVALHAPANVFSEGEELRLDLLVRDTPCITGLNARVVRREATTSLVGCTFVSPEDRQEKLLDKLVLEVQKRMIAQRKAESGKQDAQAAGQHPRDGDARDADNASAIKVESDAGTELEV